MMLRVLKDEIFYRNPFRVFTSTTTDIITHHFTANSKFYTCGQWIKNNQLVRLGRALAVDRACG